MLYFPFERSSEFVEKKLDEIRLKMQRDIKGPEGIVAVSSSIGAAFYSKGKDFEALYKEADEALYESKEKGKNRITVRR